MNLHAAKTYVGMVDEENNVLYKQRFENELPLILFLLDLSKKDSVPRNGTGLVSECYEAACLIRGGHGENRH